MTGEYISFTGNDWKSDRKGINTVFALSILKTFEPIFNRHFTNLTKTLEKYADQSAFDLTKHVFECNLNVICGEYGDWRRTV